MQKKRAVRNTVEYVSKRGSKYEIRNINGELVCFLDGKKRAVTKEIKDLFYAERPEGGTYTLYFEGCCNVSPGGIGGFGCIIVDEDTGATSELSGGVRASTTNRMEIRAAIEGLKEIPKGSDVVLKSTSEYVIKTVLNFFHKRKNQDLWKELDVASEGKVIKGEWIKKFERATDSSRCSKLAEDAMYSGELMIDRGYGGANQRTFYGSNTKGNGPIKAMHLPINIENDNDKSAQVDDMAAFIKHQGINPSCAESLKKFWAAPKTFDSYARLKTGGPDRYSEMSSDELTALCGEEDKSQIGEYLSGGDFYTALRWRCRGLSMTDSIRKALVNREISQRAKGR